MDPLLVLKFAAVLVIIVSVHITEACTKEELVMVQMIHRHGATSPTVLYPEDPNPESTWTEGLDDLTMLGKFQSYALGCLLRSRYEDFITSDPTELEVKSGAHKDCFKSALSFVACLYEPNSYWEFVQNYSWQPIYVATEKEEDAKFFSRPECNSADAESKRQMLKESSPLFQTYENLIYYWKTNSGWELNDIGDVELLYNILETEALHNLTVPEWATNYWTELKYFHDVAFAARFKTKLQQKLRGGPLADLLLQDMKKKAANEMEKTKVIVYSTHGFNIAAFLSFMDMWNYQRPLPCATVLAELYNHEDEYYVRYLYLNSTIPEKEPQVFYVLKVPGCSEFCPMSYVIDYTKDLIPKNWEEECQIS